jgi:hypothetical protein
MDLETVMQQLEALGKERMKKMYITNGAHEPLFGVATGEMKPRKSKSISRWLSSFTAPATMTLCTSPGSLQIRKR